MTETEPFPIDLSLLGQHSVIRSTPPWEEVQAARQRLARLRADERPYERMEEDRDTVVGYAALMQRCSDTIAMAICLAVRLSRFSTRPSASERLTDGLRILSAGLELRSLDETDTRAELLRCLREVFGSKDPPTLAPLAIGSSKEQQEQWRMALEHALASVRDLPRADSSEVQQRAWAAWRRRFIDAPTKLTPPDIDYLYSLAENSLPGTILRARLNDVSVRELSRAHVAAIAASSSAAPLWFALGVLGQLGFDLGKDLESVIGSGMTQDGAKDAQLFVSQSQQSSPKPGVMVIVATAGSVVADWRPDAAMAALTVTAEEYHSPARMDLQSYFQSRLQGLLVEVGTPETVDDALKRVKWDQIRSTRPGTRLGLLFAQPPTPVPPYPYAVRPKNAKEAASIVFHSPAT